MGCMKYIGEIRRAATFLKVHKGGLKTFGDILLKICVSILWHERTMRGGCKQNLHI